MGCALSTIMRAVLYIMPGSPHRYELMRRPLHLFTRMLHGVEEGDVRALHRTRVASRRLRELLPILQLDSDLTRKLGRRLRDVTRRLGVVRELDVLSVILDELRESGRFSERALGPVTRSVASAHDEARKRLRAKLSTTELRRLAGKLADVASRLEAPRPGADRQDEKAWRWALDARIASRAERLDRTMREAGAVYLPERLHAVRIAVKKLRYAAELRASAAGTRRDVDVQTLKRAQDALGRMHDLQVLIDQVRQVQAGLTPPDIGVWDDLDTLVDALENDCRRLHARYMRARAALAAVCARSVVHPHAGSTGRAAARRAAAS
jgi:CHAD domain-containing protein